MTRAVAEWIGKTDDTPVPPRVRDRVREKDGNACRGCSRPLHNESAECDHAQAIINGGANRESNLQTLCEWCHDKKTGADVKQKSASYTRRKAHRGIRSKPRSTFRTNKDQPFKAKIGGGTVRRDQS